MEERRQLNINGYVNCRKMKLLKRIRIKCAFVYAYMFTLYRQTSVLFRLMRLIQNIASIFKFNEHLRTTYLQWNGDVTVTTFRRDHVFESCHSPRGLTFTWWECYGFCQRHKPTELAHSFLFCSCVCFCLYGPFNCISFNNFSR